MSDKLVGFNANPPPKRAPVKGAAVGVAAILAIATPFIAGWEGKENTPYLDVVGVKTVCYGHTGNVQNRIYSDAECRSILNGDAEKHLAPIMKCVPTLAEKPKVAAASLSLAFNIGTSGFCRSTAAKHFRVRNWDAGCTAIGRFVYAGGKKVRGLENRRREEVALCREGLK